MSVLEIVNIIFVAETSAAVGLLYFLSIEKDMILSFIGNVILKEVWFNDNEKIYTDNPETLISIPKWKKPLGACQTCTMVWIGVVMFVLFTYFISVFVLLSVVSNGLLIFRKIV